MSRIVIVILIYHLHKLYIALTCWACSGDVMCFLWGTDKLIDLSWVLSKKTGRWIMSRIVTVILIYHHQKPVDLTDISPHGQTGSHQISTLCSYLAVRNTGLAVMLAVHGGVPQLLHTSRCVNSASLCVTASLNQGQGHVNDGWNWSFLNIRFLMAVITFQFLTSPDVLVPQRYANPYDRLSWRNETKLSLRDNPWRSTRLTCRRLSTELLAYHSPYLQASVGRVARIPLALPAGKCRPSCSHTTRLTCRRVSAEMLAVRTSGFSPRPTSTFSSTRQLTFPCSLPDITL
jgi:hypothetical protein